MKIRNAFIAAAVTSATLMIASPSAWAGSPQQHRWEGVAIGVGAAILGSALIHHHGIHVYTPARMIHTPRTPFRHHRPKIRHRYHGHGKPHYRNHRWKNYHRGIGGPHKRHMGPKHGNRFPFQGRDYRRGHGPEHHRPGSGNGNHHKDRRF